MDCSYYALFSEICLGDELREERERNSEREKMIERERQTTGLKLHMVSEDGC